LAVLVAVAVSSSAWATITVTVEPGVSLPGQASVDIVADIPADDAIVGWGVDLSYNPAILGLAGGGWDTAVAIGPAFDEVFAADGDFLAGLVPFAGAPLSGNDVVLATVTFDILASDLTELCVSDTNPLVWNGSFWQGFGDLTEGFALNPPPVGAFAPAAYSCVTIPEPASLMLLAAGGLLALRRR
jgi:hypothetical protein